MFGTEDEYRRGSSAALGIVPDTPYGFYSNWRLSRLQTALERFYREHRRRKGDGLDVLAEVSGMTTTSLRSDWERFVLALSYERSGKVAGP